MNKLLICFALIFLQASCLVSNQTDPDLTNWTEVKIKIEGDEDKVKLFKEKMFNNSAFTDSIYKEVFRSVGLPKCLLGTYEPQSIFNCGWKIHYALLFICPND